MEQQQFPETEQDLEPHYVPRPRTQVWGARVALVIFVIFVIYQILSIARGGM